MNKILPLGKSTIEFNKKSFDNTDNDGLLDGEEIQVKYLSSYMLSNDVIQPNANKLTFVMKSDPRKVDSDDDGINDNEDTAPLIEGLEGSITGQLTLISCHDGKLDFRQGHAFFVYTSYINDTLDLSKFSYGWSRIDTSESWSKENLKEDIPTQYEYTLKIGESVSIGMGAFAEQIYIYNKGERNGFNYNMEVYKYLNMDSEYTYVPNAYIYEDITINQLNTIIEYGYRNNYWSAITNNCAKVASNAWNLISKTTVDPYLYISVSCMVPTPKGLYFYLKGLNEDNINYPFPMQFQ